MKKFFNRLSLLICLLLFLLFCLNFTACKSNRIDLTCFNTPVIIKTDKLLKDSEIKEIKQTLDQLENTYSILNGSFVTNFNNLSQGQMLNLTNQSLEILQQCLEAYNISQKRFNPLIYPLIKLWGFQPNNYSVFSIPNSKDIQAVLDANLLCFSKIVIDQKNLTVSKTDKDVQIDLGGILKGYACDLIVDILKATGVKSGYVNIGGSSLYLFNTNSLAIRHPLSINDTIIEIDKGDLKNISVSTSGTYEKYHKLDGKTYSHIISPFDGYPTQTGVVSATILGVSGIMSDALTTALCLCEYNFGQNQSELTGFMKDILTIYPNAEIYAIYNKNDQKIVITNKKEGERFTLLDKTFTVHNI